MAVLTDRGARLLRFEAPALSSLPEEKQEKGEHAVASRCPLPLLGGQQHVHLCREEFQAKVTANDPGTQEVSAQGFSSDRNEHQKAVSGIRAEVYLSQVWKQTKERVVI